MSIFRFQVNNLNNRLARNLWDVGHVDDSLLLSIQDLEMFFGNEQEFYTKRSENNRTTDRRPENLVPTESANCVRERSQY